MANRTLLETLYARKRIYNQPIVGYFYRRRLAALLSSAQLDSSNSVLDIGFENGMLLALISAQHPANLLYGIEANPRITEHTAQTFSKHNLSDITLYQGDFLSFDFQGQQFDRILASSVMEHIQDIEKAASRVAHLLHPNGKAIILSPYEKWHYVLLRKIFGYQKPDDHYHDADTITQTFSKKLYHLKTSFYPRWGRLYKIDCFQKRGE